MNAALLLLPMRPEVVVLYGLDYFSSLPVGFVWYFATSDAWIDNFMETLLGHCRLGVNFRVRTSQLFPTNTINVSPGWADQTPSALSRPKPVLLSGC